MKKWEKDEAKRRKRANNGKRANGDTEEKPKEKPKCRMHDGDADNFLNLAAAMKILLARTITKSELPRARELLTDYWWRFVKVRASSYIYIMCSQDVYGS